MLTRYLDLLTIFLVATPIGRPEHSSSKTDVRPRLNSFNQYVSDGSGRECVVLINGMQLHFDFSTRLSLIGISLSP